MDCLHNLRGQASCAALAVAAAVTFGLAAPNVGMAATTQSTMLAQASAAPSPAPKSSALAKDNAGSRTDRVDARIKDLHAKLHISADQEDKWNAVAQVMRENAQVLDSLTQTRVKSAASMTAVDDLNSYNQIAEAHAEGVKKFVPCFKRCMNLCQMPRRSRQTRYSERVTERPLKLRPSIANMATRYLSNRIL